MMKTTYEIKTVFYYSLAGIALASVLAVYFYNTQKLKSTNNWVEHTQEVLRKSDNVLLDILNIESGSRGYLLTEDQLFLKQFNNSVNSISNNLESLETITKDNHSQQLRISWLRTATDERLIFTKNIIEVGKFKGLKEAVRIITTGEGRMITDKIRTIIADINSEELRLLKERKAESEKSNKNNEIIFSFLIVVLILFAIIIIRNQKIRATYAKKEKQSAEYTRSLIEASLDPLVTISPEGKITDVNNESVNVTGLPREQLIGTVFSSYFTEPEKAEQGYLQVFEKGFVEDYPLTVKHKSGKLIDVLYNASVYKDEKGVVLGVFAAARDITNRKKAEEQLLAVNKELEAFTYSVSHDLRAPLRAINGYANILLEDYSEKLDDDGISSLVAIKNNSKRMGTLIDDLLAFSRLGRKAITTSEINMNVLVKTVKEEQIQGNIQEIKFSTNELLPGKGQQELIKQVWVNLISNAIKYSQHKLNSIIEIGSYYKDNLVVYYVKDNGVGFDMQYYDKLFGVFQRLHSSEEFEGTGIGLAIVKKIINRHNGTVWAESKVNEGTCFYFTLPSINSN